jgi:hypothetical protein
MINKIKEVCFRIIFYIVLPVMVLYAYVPRIYTHINHSYFLQKIPDKEHTVSTGRDVDIDMAFQEADTLFTYKGRPIDPQVIAQFSNWISDYRHPITVSVDIIQAYDTNQYSSNFEIGEDGFVRKTISSVNDDFEEYIGYKWLGRLKNGLHVLRSYESGGGTGVFNELRLVKIEKYHGLDENRQTFDRLLATIVYSSSLGDRFEGEITVYDDYVVLGKSSRQDIGRTPYNEKTKILIDFR